MKKIHYIYGLYDPNDPVIRYVGVTKHPEQRLREHRTRKCGLSLWQWVRALQHGPEMIILEECNPDVSEEREHFWINVYKAAGSSLLNHFGVKTKNRTYLQAE